MFSYVLILEIAPTTPNPMNFVSIHDVHCIHLVLSAISWILRVGFAEWGCLSNAALCVYQPAPLLMR